ncbi:MAG TPA: hypothetical protein VD963_02415 [Phycisphaerales bacterium]|nr:hypothetical protein [Phycisphaerales bacterium]
MTRNKLHIGIAGIVAALALPLGGCEDNNGRVEEVTERRNEQIQENLDKQQEAERERLRQQNEQREENAEQVDEAIERQRDNPPPVDTPPATEPR